MDIKQLRSFVAVVDYCNFSRAAAKLNISQASVSTHLLQLEKELGVKLANRTTKTIEITDAGFRVYKYATQILELKNNIYEICSSDARHIIRVAASAIPAAYILPGVFQQYRQLFTNDYLKISQCEIKDIIDGVLENRFDAGLIDQRITKEGLRCVPICSNPMVMITAANDRYLTMQQRGASIKELLQEPVILREEGQDRSADLFLDRMGIERNDLRVIARVNDLETIKNMVASGMGVSLISEIAAHNFIKEHRVLKFDYSISQEDNDIYLIFPDACTAKDRAWHFIDYLMAGSHMISLG